MRKLIAVGQATVCVVQLVSTEPFIPVVTLFTKNMHKGVPQLFIWSEEGKFYPRPALCFVGPKISDKFQHGQCLHSVVICEKPKICWDI